MELNESNYKQGFLTDSEHLCGVAEDGNSRYLVYLVSLLSGHVLKKQSVGELEVALRCACSLIPNGRFESMGFECGGGNCSADGCDPSQCPASAVTGCDQDKNVSL